MQIPKQSSVQHTPETRKASTASSSSKATAVEKETNPDQKSYAQIAASQTVKKTQEKGWTEATSSS